MYTQLKIHVGDVMFDSTIPLLQNPAFTVDELTIASVDVISDGSLNVVFDLHGFTIETLVNFVKRYNVDIIIDSIYILDGGYAYFDILYFDDIKPYMVKLIIDEYMFNNICIESINRGSKNAVILYKDIRFYCDISYNLKINMATNIHTNDEVDPTEYKQHRKFLHDELNGFINDHDLNVSSNMEVRIQKMYEAAVDNTQYYVRIRRNDFLLACPLGSSNTLEYACFQTKHHNGDKVECIERAWMMASYAAKFIGLSSMEKVKLINFTDDEIAIAKNEDNITVVF